MTHSDKNLEAEMTAVREPDVHLKTTPAERCLAIGQAEQTLRLAEDVEVLSGALVKTREVCAMQRADLRVAARRRDELIRDVEKARNTIEGLKNRVVSLEEDLILTSEERNGLRAKLGAVQSAITPPTTCSPGCADPNAFCGACPVDEPGLFNADLVKGCVEIDTCADAIKP